MLILISSIKFKAEMLVMLQEIICNAIEITWVNELRQKNSRLLGLWLDHDQDHKMQKPGDAVKLDIIKKKELVITDW